MPNPEKLSLKIFPIYKYFFPRSIPNNSFKASFWLFFWDNIEPRKEVESVMYIINLFKIWKLIVFFSVIVIYISLFGFV